MSEQLENKHMTHHFHSANIMQCLSPDCLDEGKTKLFCKICSLRTIDSVNHLIDHFEFIKKCDDSVLKLGSNSEYTKSLLFDDIASNLNENYLTFLNKSCNVPDKIINQILDCDCIVKDVFVLTFQRCYNSFIKNIEDFSKTSNKKIGDVSMLNCGEKEIYSEIKRNLEFYTSELNDPCSIKSELDSICMMAKSKLNKLKVKDFEKKEFKFSLNSYSINWNTGSNTFQTSGASEGKIYEVITSKAVIGGAFLCKIKINSLRTIHQINATGQMCIGILKTNKKENQNENTFYTRTVLVSSNGYLHNKGTMGGNKKIVNSPWKENDVLILKRDSKNTLFYGLNKEESCVEISKSIKGKIQIVMSFNSSQCRDDIFEIIHLEYN